MYPIPIKILSIEDNDGDFGLIKNKLEKLDFEFEIARVCDEPAFKKYLKEFCPHLILSDFSLPSFNGLAALKIAKELCPLVPFIFVSGAIGEEKAVEIMIQGANDYVLKDNLNKLIPAIKRALSEAMEKAHRKQAEKKLEIKVDELKNLIYRLSHDIRGPICSIKGVVNLIQQLENKSMDEVLEYNEIIGQVVKKLEGIVYSLGSFQFIYEEETGIDEINLEEFLSKLKETISKIEGFRGVDFYIFHKGLKNFIFKRDLLFSVLFNLIHNSIIFNDKNKPQKKINFSIDISVNRINLIIEDNGIGIPVAIQDKIFDMFYRGTNLSKGAGLGLYITKSILEKLHGEIKVESQESIGTKMIVNIPFQQMINDIKR